MEQKELKDKRNTTLEGLGFEEKETGKWVKSVEGGWAYWDFRKAKDKGRFYIAVDGGGFMGDDQSKEYSEYIEFRKAMNGDIETKPKPIKKSTVVNPSKEDSIVLRGDESSIIKVVKARRLDVIMKNSKDGKGEGILYYNLGDKIGYEPSADLIDLVANDMGNIETRIVEHGTRNHFDISTGDEYQTCYAIVEAKDTVTGSISVSTSEEVIDFDEMKKNKRSFAFVKVVRKARRNAQERLMCPRKILVPLVMDLMDEYKKEAKTNIVVPIQR